MIVKKTSIFPAPKETVFQKLQQLETLQYIAWPFGMKAFDIIALDYVLITKTQFFQHYIPETKGCAGYHSFGYNRKEQLKHILALPFAALLTAWVCTLF